MTSTSRRKALEVTEDHGAALANVCPTHFMTRPQDAGSRAIRVRESRKKKGESLTETPFSTHVSNVRAAVLAWDAFQEFQTPARLARTKSAVDMLAARLLAAGSALPGEKAAVIQWVVRFRTEKATVFPQPSAKSEFRATLKVARQEAKGAKRKPHQEQRAGPIQKQRRPSTLPRRPRLAGRRGGGRTTQKSMGLASRSLHQGQIPPKQESELSSSNWRLDIRPLP